jgi:hypothetical protein
MPSNPEGVDRRRFLRRLGGTIAVGLGIALFPAARAKAAITRCCALTGNCGPCHPLSDAALWCSSIQCCVCEAGGLDDHGCKNYSFPPC